MPYFKVWKYKNEENEEREGNKKCDKRNSFWTLFAVFWVLSGLLAIITSHACIGGLSFKDNFIALILAMFFGPFFFIYLYMKDGYCYKTK